MKWKTSGAVMALLAGFIEPGQSQESGKGCAICLADDRNRELQSTVRGMIQKFGELPYKFGGSSPEDGGFDCSGAIHYLMKELGHEVPRTSAQQYEWLKKSGNLIQVSSDVDSLDDEEFDELREGDLLFWSGTYETETERVNKMTHVAVYLGKEEDGHPIMACSSNGRSYRGRKGNGFGVYDFKLPKLTSSSKFEGYGRLVNSKL